MNTIWLSIILLESLDDKFLTYRFKEWKKCEEQAYKKLWYNQEYLYANPWYPQDTRVAWLKWAIDKVGRGSESQ